MSRPRRLLEDSLARLAGAQHHLRRDSRAIALTFDDGPDPEFTPLVLDALSKEGIQATFFFVGRHARSHPELVLRARSEGHSIGSHSENHVPAAEQHRRTLMDDYRRGRASVENILGEPVRLFRPPQGSVSLASVVSMRYLSLSPWLWTVNPDDWRLGTTTDSILSVVDRIESGDVVLLHDGTANPGAGVASDRSATVAVLEGLNERMARRGFSFAAL